MKKFLTTAALCAILFITAYAGDNASPKHPMFTGRPARPERDAENDWRAKNPYYLAIRSGDINEIKKLINKDNVNTPLVNEETGQAVITPLFIAVISDNPKSVKYLLSIGADVNYNPGYFTPLSISAIRKSAGMVKLLVENGADLNYKNPLLSAVTGRTSDPELVKYLIEKGAKVDAPDGMGVTALMTAALYGKFEEVKILVQSGADVNAVSKLGYDAQGRVLGTTPLFDALATMGTKDLPSYDIAKYLIDNGASVVFSIEKLNGLFPFYPKVKNYPNDKKYIKNLNKYLKSVEKKERKDLARALKKQ